MSFDSDDDYEFCNNSLCSGSLPFDPTSLENVILIISDIFNIRIIMSNKKIAAAAIMTTGLAIAGGVVGRHYGGKVGAVVGGAVGGACGVGIVAVTMRQIWTDVKPKLSELFDIVYDYLSGLGIEDYKKAIVFITSGTFDSTQLAMLIIQTLSELLGKKVLSSLASA